MRAVVLYFTRPIEISVIVGILLCYLRLFSGNSLSQALLTAFIPLLIILALFTLSFLLLMFITWISTSHTEV